MRLVPTTFTVHRWYSLGPCDTVTVAIPVGASIDPGRAGVPGRHPAARQRWRTQRGNARQNVVACGCGFARYYDPATAARSLAVGVGG
jgi:hypothetical protein